MESVLWDPVDGSEDGPVSAVDSADLRAAWDLFEDVRARNLDQTVAIGIALFERACSPGARVRSVYYRAAMLRLCERRGLLSPWLHDGQLEAAVFRVAATFPMKKMQVGTVDESLPFDLPEFTRQIESECHK
jgi:hypothetical protein